MKITYLAEGAFKNIATLKKDLDKRYSADDIRADAKKILYNEIGNFLITYVYKHMTELQLVPKTGIFAQDMRYDYSGEWTFSNLPAWGKYVKYAPSNVPFKNPIEIVSIAPGTIHINYNLGHVVIETEDTFPDTRSIGIVYDKLVDREKDLTKVDLAFKFVYKLKKMLTKDIENYGFNFDKSMKDAANFILNADIIVDNIIIELPKNLSVRIVASTLMINKKGNAIPISSNEVQKLRSKGEFEYGGWKKRLETDEDYEKAAAELSVKLRKIFTFTGPGKMFVKRGRDITNITI